MKTNNLHLSAICWAVSSWRGSTSTPTCQQREQHPPDSTSISSNSTLGKPKITAAATSEQHKHCVQALPAKQKLSSHAVTSSSSPPPSLMTAATNLRLNTRPHPALHSCHSRNMKGRLPAAPPCIWGVPSVYSEECKHLTQLLQRFLSHFHFHFW